MSLNEINSRQNPKNTLETISHQLILPPVLDEDILYKLFNDSDILDPYGLHLSNDASSSNNKKGLELMAYQPIYDLSDIINDQNDLDADANVPTPSELRTQNKNPKQEFSSSVLNTPCHEQIL